MAAADILTTTDPARDPHVEPAQTSRRSLPNIGWVGWLAAGFMVLVILVTIFAPVIAPHNPNAVDVAAMGQSPSADHLLGTDSLGRDLLSRLIYGGRAALLGAALVVLIATPIGVTIAITTAWIGGRFDQVVSRLIDIGFAFPALLVAILAVAIFGPGLVAPVIALSIAYVPVVARLVRSAAIRERAMPYIAACSVQGFSSVSICVRHILPNLLSFVVVQATLYFGYALLDLAALSFLGLGVQPPTADWGRMVAEGQPDILAKHPQQSIYAGAVLVLVVLAVVTLGERVNRWRETTGS